MLQQPVKRMLYIVVCQLQGLAGQGFAEAHVTKLCHVARRGLWWLNVSLLQASINARHMTMH
jgi:hypothetical protein